MSDMDLPAGMTCGDCVNWRRCTALIESIEPTATTCDWSPSRFAVNPAKYAGEKPDIVEQARQYIASHKYYTGSDAPAIVPALCAEVERLTGELSSLRGVCDGACADIATQQEIIGNMANRLGDKQAEVEQLRDLWRNVTMRCQEREQEIERLRAALEWYADPANYGRGGCPGNLQLGETWATREVMIWKRDNGQRAREALEVKP